jgi:hypothetical protein
VIGAYRVEPASREASSSAGGREAMLVPILREIG